MTPTNAQARQVDLAIRQHRREAGELSAAETTLKARDPDSGETFSLAVSIGDRLRMFSRVYDADTGGRKRWLASNGDVVEVTAVQPEGLRVRNAGRRGQGHLGAAAALARTRESDYCAWCSRQARPASLERMP